MNIRLEMLDAAARGARTLDEGWHGDTQPSHASIAFVLSRQCEDGGFRGRGDRSDLYYTTFAVQTLCALGRPLPEGFRSYLEGFRDLQSLGLINLCCLVRCWACVGMDSLEPAGRLAMREAFYSFRSRDGGFAVHPGQSGGSAYGCFLALSALQDLGDAAVAPGGAVATGMVACVLPLRRPEGGFANESSVPIAMAPSTAAAIMVLTQTTGASEGGSQGWPPPITEETVRDSIASCAEWLRSSRRADGGFAAVQGIESDLLSTATALHALAMVNKSSGNSNDADKQAGSKVGLPVGAVERSQRKSLVNPAETPSHRELTRNYVLGLCERGGFCGGASDRTCDCEYTFYGLLALGHLTEIADCELHIAD